MKSNKVLLALVSGVVLFILGLGTFHSLGGDLVTIQWIMVSLVVIGALAGIMIAIKRRKEEKLGIPIDDERSISIKERAGSKAFHLSFYIWTLVLIFSSNMSYPAYNVIAIGLVASSVLFGVLYMLESKKS